MSTSKSKVKYVIDYFLPLRFYGRWPPFRNCTSGPITGKPDEKFFSFYTCKGKFRRGRRGAHKLEMAYTTLVAGTDTRCHTLITPTHAFRSAQMCTILAYGSIENCTNKLWEDLLGCRHRASACVCVFVYATSLHVPNGLPAIAIKYLGTLGVGNWLVRKSFSPEIQPKYVLTLAFNGRVQRDQLLRQQSRRRRRQRNRRECVSIIIIICVGRYLCTRLDYDGFGQVFSFAERSST